MSAGKTDALPVDGNTDRGTPGNRLLGLVVLPTLRTRL